MNGLPFDTLWQQENVEKSKKSAFQRWNLAIILVAEFFRVTKAASSSPNLTILPPEPTQFSQTTKSSHKLPYGDRNQAGKVTEPPTLAQNFFSRKLFQENRFEPRFEGILDVFFKRSLMKFSLLTPQFFQKQKSLSTEFCRRTKWSSKVADRPTLFFRKISAILFFFFSFSLFLSLPLFFPFFAASSLFSFSNATFLWDFIRN